VPHLLIHDDLIGPYYSLSADSLLVGGRPSGAHRPGQIIEVWVVVPLNFDTKLSPYAAQMTGRVYFANYWKRCLAFASEPWKQRLLDRWSGRSRDVLSNLVLRTTLVTADEYLGHLEKSSDHERRPVRLTKDIRRALERTYRKHKQMWLVEFSLPELLCGNRSKIGEILLPLSDGRKTRALQIKRGRNLTFPLTLRMLGQVYAPVPAWSVADIGIESHIPMFTAS
jgi:hypothetical protein